MSHVLSSQGHSTVSPDRADGGGRSRWWVAPSVLYAVSFALLVLFASLRWVPGVVIAVVLLVVASLVLNLALRRLRAAGRPLWQQLLVPVALLVVGAVLVAVRIAGRGADGFAFFGTCLAFLGIGHGVSAIRWTNRLGVLVAGIGWTAVCAVAFVVGLFGASGTVPAGALVAMAAGVLLSPIGLNLLSGGVLSAYARERWRIPGGAVAMGVAGGVLVVAGIWTLVGLGGVEIRYAVYAGLAVLLLVGAIAANSPADVLIVASVVALLWSIAPRAVKPDSALVLHDGDTVLAALGDSFMSGEGAKRFYTGTNTKRVNECRRAPTAYAPVAVGTGSPGIPTRLAFVACSGARAVDIDQHAQYPGEPIGGPPGGLDQLDDLSWLMRDKHVRIQAVIVSIGGNDALFGEIGRACVGPGDCTEIGDRWLANLNQVKRTIYGTYQRIRAAVGDQVPIVVIPYPIPISPSRCSDSLLTANEHKFLEGYTRQLDAVVARAAADAGLYYLGEMATVLQRNNLRICDQAAGKVGVNFFGLNAVDGLLEESVNPLNWFHNSLHPNARGHRAMSQTLVQWLQGHPNLTPRPDPTRDVGPPAIASVQQIMNDPGFRTCGTPGPGLAHCDGSADQWQAAQVVAVLRRVWIPLLLVAAGSWILWLLAIWSWRESVQHRVEPALVSTLGLPG